MVFRFFVFTYRLLFTCGLYFIAPLVVMFEVAWFEEHLTLALSIAALLYLITAFFGIKLSRDSRQVQLLMNRECLSEREECAEFNDFYHPFLLLSLFIVISRYWWMVDPSVFTIDLYAFCGKYLPEETAWITYGLQISFSAILFDLLESYHLSMSHIEYGGFWFSTFVFIHKCLIGIYFWKLIFFMWQGYIGYWKPNRRRIETGSSKKLQHEMKE